MIPIYFNVLPMLLISIITAFDRLCTDCGYQEILCPNHEDCLITCDSTSVDDVGCTHSLILCPTTSDACIVNCFGPRSCESVQIDGRAQIAKLRINAMGEDAISSGHILCPSNRTECTIECIGSRTCQSLSINASHITNTNISLRASGQQAFKGGNIHTGSYSTIAMDCDGLEACTSTILSGPHTQIHIKAIGDYVLANSNISCQGPREHNCHINVSGNNALQNTMFFARYSFNSLDLVCNDSYSTGCTDATIICDRDGSSCSMQLTHSNHWQCVDATSTCQIQLVDKCSQFADDPRDSDMFLFCTLFASTNVINWMNDTDYCVEDSWADDMGIKIECNNDTNWITRLNLNANEYGGHLITSGRWPQYLTELDIEQWGAKTRDLQRFNGVWNWSTITQLQYLQEIDVENNNFTGMITNDDWNMIMSIPALQKLILDENYFETNFSAVEIAKNASFVRMIMLADNLFYGTLDTSIHGFLSKFPSLREFSVENNHDLGGDWHNLDGIANNICPDLRRFEMANNRFTGTVTLSDDDLSLPSGLSIFDISNNSFSGSINWSIFDSLITLDRLDLSYNHFVGDIDWDVVGSLSYRDLDVLALDHNNFSGFANFKDIDSNLRINLDTHIICDPSRYVCSYDAHPTNRSDFECRGKTQCESTCMCSDGLTAIIAPDWNVSAVWSSLFLFVTIYIETVSYEDYGLMHWNDTDCNISEVLDEYTLQLIPQYSVCWFSFEANNNKILIDFASPLDMDSVLSLSEHLSIKEDAFMYTMDNHRWFKFQQSLNVDCGVFDEQTMLLIGNDDAVCYHESDSISIDLPYTATIGLNDSIAIKANAISYKRTSALDLGWITWKYELVLPISHPQTIDKPHIVTSIPSQIGICNDLILDARSTTHLGGREALFVWDLFDANSVYIGTYYGEYVIIEMTFPSSSSPPRIDLNVTNWYHASSFETFLIYTSDVVVPMVALHGIDEYLSTNDQLNDKVSMYSSITFDMDCNYNEESSDYTIQWFVDVDAQDEHVMTDESRVDSLRMWLDSQQNVDAISIDPSLYFQSGIMYTFTINIKHIHGDYDINATHDIATLFSELQCNIAGGDMVLNTEIGLDFFSLHPHTLRLDGETLTYDPDQEGGLQFGWQCFAQNGTDCNDLIQDVTNGITSAWFDNELHLIYSTFYSFRFVLNVSDESNTFRKHCVDEITFQFQTADEVMTDNVVFPLLISVIAIEESISINGKIRLMTTLVNI
eukprot:148077_1